MPEAARQLILAAEALLFASPEPISVARLCELLSPEGATPEEIKKALAELDEQYKSTGRAFRIIPVAEGYRIMTRDDMAPVIERLNPPRRSKGITDASMETLAVVAYRQPISRAQIETVRGVNSEAALRNLLEKGMLAPTGRSEEPGRPLLYGTTPEFLKYFNLASLDDLPKERDFPQTSVREKA